MSSVSAVACAIYIPIGVRTLQANMVAHHALFTSVCNCCTVVADTQFHVICAPFSNTLCFSSSTQRI
ncbi:hypothetical protein PC116_g21248 [Phytophthora cactorum]|uniref:Uncharacterized protein n=1 Tax=Phytophthora cactorum TaxID=29920 RepID=A0A8T1C4Z8_9STRA|nr:hypothetical protein PC114_g18755 [Phytophthora cactorum]KAG2914628.1 hypothetical protein PC117_g18259 [Phytophthora cactorum]KAG3165960.1 hypothetical protein PC128_g19834 [Phytophthora cactorum]KAG4046646.1 hypothetical protein PC123_g17977 [Phytophthora cactorum]KAG4230450.1 hypothetical protein PC116_g21248 [Phytophthora cactorum]